MKRNSPQWLDLMYNNRARVPTHAEYFSRWAAQSLAVRSQLACELDLPYGSGAGATLDAFPAPAATPSAVATGAADRGSAASSHAASGAPVAVFIHGGYWRSLDKSEHSFVVPALQATGAAVFLTNYALCPAVSISDIVLQQVLALAWVWRNASRFGGDPARITVMGHSAGGHLAAMLLNCDWPAVGADLPRDLVKSALSIAGLYDLQPIARTPFLQDALRLSDAESVCVSPALMPAPPRGVLYSVAGGIESAEFLRQNRLIRQAWGRQRVPVCEALPGRDHFSVLEALCEPGHRLNALAHQLLA